MRNRHAELIHAWAEGAEIERRETYCRYQMNQEPIIVSEEWLPCPNPSWVWNEEYRIKPSPVPDYVSYLCLNYPHKDQWFESTKPYQHDCIKITRNFKTWKITSVEIVG